VGFDRVGCCEGASLQSYIVYLAIAKIACALQKPDMKYSSHEGHAIPHGTIISTRSHNI